MMSNDELTSSQAAAKLLVAPETLRRYESQGLIQSKRTSGGHRRFKSEDIEALKSKLSEQTETKGLEKEESKQSTLQRAQQEKELKALLIDLGIDTRQEFNFRTIGEVVSEESSFSDYIFIPVSFQENLKTNGYFLISDYDLKIYFISSRRDTAFDLSYKKVSEEIKMQNKLGPIKDNVSFLKVFNQIRRKSFFRYLLGISANMILSLSAIINILFIITQGGSKSALLAWLLVIAISIGVALLTWRWFPPLYIRLKRKMSICDSPV